MSASSTANSVDAGLRELTGISDPLAVLREIYPSYPGGKSGAGVADQIIRRFPPHGLYIDLFLGMGGVFRAKRPSLRSVGFDSDSAVVEAWHRADWPGLTVVRDDGIKWLELTNRNPTVEFVADALIYADPPYPLETRTKKRLYGEHDWDDAKHRRFLKAAVDCQCSLYISTYDTPWYFDTLDKAGFQLFRFDAMTRGGVMRTETVYYRIAATNKGFATPLTAPGDNYREREKMKKRKRRWRAMFNGMTRAQQADLLEALIDAYGEGEKR